MNYIKELNNIKEWITNNNRSQYPSTQSDDENERRIANLYSYIRTFFINVYQNLEITEEKEKFKKEHPYINELIKINTEIEEILFKNQNLILEEIKSWYEENKNEQLPNETNKQYKTIKQRIGFIVSKYTKNKMLDQYEQIHPEFVKLKENKDYIQQNYIEPNKKPKKEKEEFNYLEKTRKIKQFVVENKRLPDINSKNLEERKLNHAQSRIMKELVKPFYRCNSKEEKQEYENNYPEIYEVISLFDEIKQVARMEPRSQQIQYLLKAKEWMEKNNSKLIPSEHKNADEEELFLARKLSYIRSRFINAYFKYETEEERQMFRIKHPETLKIISLYNELIQNEKKYTGQELGKRTFAVSVAQCDEAEGLIMEIEKSIDDKEKIK